jgi:hypothetical protein
MEHKFPNSAIMMLGDFNQQPLKLPNHYCQVVTKPTRKDRIIDKCYINIQNAYNYCHQLGRLGNSDHNVMQLLPTYRPKSTHKPKIVQKRDYKDENIDNLRACLDLTDWSVFIDKTDDIDRQVNAFNDYLAFCTDLYIPLTE